jgi:hypothetical protein
MDVVVIRNSVRLPQLSPALEAVVDWLLVLSLLGTAASILLLLRNKWVYKVRLGQLNGTAEGMSEYMKLPSYLYMVLHFWIWNVEKFKQNNKPHDYGLEGQKN